MSTLRTIKQFTVAGALAVTVSLGSIAPVTATYAASAAAVEVQERAQVAVVLQATNAPAGEVAYLVTARNVGEGRARSASITLPFNGAQLQLVSAQVSSTDMWVRSIQANGVTIKLEELGSDNAATATLRFKQLAPGAKLSERASYTWSDEYDSSAARSNLPAGQSGNVLALSTSDDAYRFNSAIFVPSEPVTLWYTTPSGATVSTEVKGDKIVDASSTKDQKDEEGGTFVPADNEGAISVRLVKKDLPRGSYLLVARGNWSGLEATSSFEVR